jgi:pimeloyl-ACP methyl ester carboxylesterase
MADYLKTPAGRRIAYEQLAGDGPGIVFLGGLKSDMQGSKAQYLRDWAASTGRAFLRFDYSGHGLSDSAFTDGCIGDWAEDAQQVIAALTNGPQVLVGSSMGGWIGLILATRLTDKIAGLIGIASAPDFTEDAFWAGFDGAQKAELAAKGQIALPSDYDEPYIITQRLIEDGREHLVLRKPLPLPFPARFLQGTADNSVALSVATRIIQHATGPDIRLTVVKGADHSFSTPECLQLIQDSVSEVLQHT